LHRRERRAGWPLDVRISNLAVACLPVASQVRFKLFTPDHR
jgi:hypothetical protein